MTTQLGSSRIVVAQGVSRRLTRGVAVVPFQLLSAKQTFCLTARPLGTTPITPISRTKEQSSQIASHTVISAHRARFQPRSFDAPDVIPPLEQQALHIIRMRS
jgi:hypothetical protein